MVRKMKWLITLGALLILIGAAIVLSSYSDEGDFVDTENQVRCDLGGIK
jgi:drug/metabolite transporter (DMT)-like permease